MKINEKNWEDKNKIKSREHLINVYRNVFNIKSFSQDKQYWTIPGQCFDKDLNVLEYSEPGQIISSGLIRENQFYGVENNQEIYEFNKQVWPNLNFYRGDFLEVMKRHIGFLPGIVNFDSLHLPEAGIEYLSRILYFLTEARIENVMLCGNFARLHPYRYSELRSPDYLIELCKKNKRIQLAYLYGWNYYRESFIYRCRSSKSPFMNIVFYKKEN